MDKNNNSGVRGLVDMDTRLNKLSKRIAEMEEAISKLERVKSVTFSYCLRGFVSLQEILDKRKECLPVIVSFSLTMLDSNSPLLFLWVTTLHFTMNIN